MLHPSRNSPAENGFSTPFGDIRVRWFDSVSGPKVVRIILPGDKRAERTGFPPADSVKHAEDESILALISDIRSFLSGNNVVFGTGMLDLAAVPAIPAAGAPRRTCDPPGLRQHLRSHCPASRCPGRRPGSGKCPCQESLPDRDPLSPSPSIGWRSRRVPGRPGDEGPAAGDGRGTVPEEREDADGTCMVLTRDPLAG